MRCSSQLSQSAVAEKGIEEEHELRKALGDCYDVIEMPFVNNAVRMEIRELELFCKRSANGIPMFRIKVEEIVLGEARFPKDRPYYKYFTIWNNWCFYATEFINNEAAAPVMEGGEIRV